MKIIVSCSHTWEKAGGKEGKWIYQQANTSEELTLRESNDSPIFRIDRVNHWNRLEPLSCDDPNPPALSVSISSLFSLCLSLSLSSDLFGYNQHVSRANWRQQTQFAQKALHEIACDVADSQVGRRTDRKHTHVGLISRSGWSDRSSPSGSTQCPFQRSSQPAIGQGDEERFVVWQRG